MIKPAPCRCKRLSFPHRWAWQCNAYAWAQQKARDDAKRERELDNSWRDADLRAMINERR